MTYTSEQIEQINNSLSIIEYAGQYLELHKEDREYVSICCFHEETDASLRFNPEKNAFYCFGCQKKGYLINFVMLYHKLSFTKAIDHILSISKLQLKEVQRSETFEYIKCANIKPKEKVVIREYLPANVMNKYTKEPIKEWLSEGITQEVLDKYDVRYDKINNTIVFPIHDEQGRIFAIKKRTLFKDYKSLGIKKYGYYQGIGTNDFLFGMYHNKQAIEKAKEVIVVEAEKGVMILESFGYENAVALSTSSITPQQMRLLLSLNCDVVFALDKDVVQKDIVKMCKPLLPFTNVSYTYDKKNLLGTKDSPYDNGKDIWVELYENRIRL